ncbi:MAG: DNA polymerase III subunit gamma/tau [Ruminococcaceae bacterium]|nr:DNA polymerase III subunit gamma/tau [Oscillospiraceae bacterium]
MAYQALYRKWRPLSFDDVVGQGHIVTTLKNEISSGKAAHAYLFCGTRGTGKTSCAKIFARAVNCLNPKDGNPCNECEICRGALDGSILDIVEIDAASNNGVDNIREIREEVSYSAAQAKYKIYIIDEVHMLSGGAFNALLKTLEEPPSHVIFILATTEAHKLPATITSRCQRFDFKRISVREIVTRLREIVTAENIDADIEALDLVARLADGAMRDALSILDQCVGACDGKITLDAARNVLSIASDEIIDDTVKAIANKDNLMIIRSVDKISSSGKDVNNYIELLIKRFRDILFCKVSKSADGLFEYSADTIESIQKASDWFTSSQLSYIIETLCTSSADAKWQKNARTIYELALLRLCDERLDVSPASLLARIEKLEAIISGGVSVSVVPTVEKISEKQQDELPPWDTFESAPEQQTQPVAEESEKTDVPLEEKISVQDIPKKEPKKAMASKVNTKASNVWGELLLVLQKKYPALYGAVSVKKAKFSDGVLYLINESYVKQIVTMFKNDFNAALGSVAGDGVRVNFVTEQEFDMITEDAEPVKNESEIVSTYTQEEDKTSDEYVLDDDKNEEESDDPLDELLGLGSDDIVIE